MRANRRRSSPGLTEAQHAMRMLLASAEVAIHDALGPMAYARAWRQMISNRIQKEREART